MRTIVVIIKTSRATTILTATETQSGHKMVAQQVFLMAVVHHGTRATGLQHRYAVQET